MFGSIRGADQNVFDSDIGFVVRWAIELAAGYPALQSAGVRHVTDSVTCFFRPNPENQYSTFVTSLPKCSGTSPTHRRVKCGLEIAVYYVGAHS